MVFDQTDFFLDRLIYENGLCAEDDQLSWPVINTTKTFKISRQNFQAETGTRISCRVEKLHLDATKLFSNRAFQTHYELPMAIRPSVSGATANNDDDGMEVDVQNFPPLTTIQLNLRQALFFPLSTFKQEKNDVF